MANAPAPSLVRLTCFFPQALFSSTLVYAHMAWPSLEAAHALGQLSRIFLCKRLTNTPVRRAGSLLKCENLVRIAEGRRRREVRRFI